MDADMGLARFSKPFAPYRADNEKCRYRFMCIEDCHVQAPSKPTIPTHAPICPKIARNYDNASLPIRYFTWATNLVVNANVKLERISKYCRSHGIKCFQSNVKTK